MKRRRRTVDGTRLTGRRARRRRALLAFIAGFVAIGSLAGGGAAWSGWTADARGNAWVQTKSVALSAVSADLNWSMTNRHDSLERTGSFEVTNTGDSAGEATLAVAAPGTLAEKLPVSMWRDSGAGCAVEPPSGVVYGTWSAIVPPAPGRLEPGASARYCVHVEVDPAQRESIASDQGSIAVEPVITASLSADGWGARTSEISVRQETSDVFPLAPDNWLPKSTSPWFKIALAADPSICLDVAKNGATAGANVITWTCDDGSNQFFRPIPVAGADNLVLLEPMHAIGMRVGVGNDGAQQLVGATSQADPAAQWYVQRIPGNRVQLVSALDGSCLNVPSEAGDIVRKTIACSESTQLVLDQGVLDVGLHPGRRVRIDLPAFPKSKTFTLFVRSGINWDPRGTLRGTTSKALTTDRAMFSGVHFAQIRDELGNVVWDDLQFRMVLGSGVQPVKGFGAE